MKKLILLCNAKSCQLWGDKDKKLYCWPFNYCKDCPHLLITIEKDDIEDVDFLEE